MIFADKRTTTTINTLEGVQKFAPKASTKNWNAGYDTLIEIYNIPTLEE